MIYEFRLYTVAPGRLPDVHARFSEHLPALFQRHGVACVGRWSALAGPDAPRFCYLLAYKDYAHREAAWASFYEDEDWWRVRAETNAGHEMVLQHDLFFLKPSAVWTADAAVTGEGPEVLHEVIQQKVAAGQAVAANQFLADIWMPTVRDAGAQVLGIFDMVAGAGMQKIVIFLAWPDARTWHKGRVAIENDSGLNAAFAAQRKKAGNAVFEGAEMNILQPATGAVHASLGRFPSA